MPIYPYKQHTPIIDVSCFVAPDARVIGQTTIGANVSIFFGAVLRGDINPIEVGNGTNIQEHAVLHTSRGLGPCVVGADVTVGHHAILHGCRVGDLCIIGMNAVVLDDAEIGEHSIVGAGSLVTMGKKFPARSMIFGSPAKVVRELTEAEIKSIVDSAESYKKVGAQYLQMSW